MNKKSSTNHDYVAAISTSGLSIYDTIQIGDPNLWIPTPELELILNKKLTGLSLEGLPIRTRSKVVKEYVCEALGYPIPRSFKKTQPRFPGQHFDTYIQKSNNLQIWNEEISINRRYVLIRVTPDDYIERVKVVSGDIISDLDKTGKLTQKYQARLNTGEQQSELIAKEDTDRLKPLLSQPPYPQRFIISPIDAPLAHRILPIEEIFNRLDQLVGEFFTDAGVDQDRNRGAILHDLICHALGYISYRDDGRYPDVRNQLLEVKLQTSPTIDLGLVRPDSTEPLDIQIKGGWSIRPCDVRYALFYANIEKNKVHLTNFYLSTGKVFFERFPQFQGKVVNTKIQIPLPVNFFD